MTFLGHKPRQYYKTLPDVHFVNFLTPCHVASCLSRVHQVLLLSTRHTETGKGKAVPVHVTRALSKSGGIAPITLKLHTSWIWVAAALPPVYELNSTHSRRLGGPQCQSVCFGKEIYCFAGIWNSIYHPKQQCFCSWRQKSWAVEVNPHFWNKI